MGINNVKNRIAEDAGKLNRRLFKNVVALAKLGNRKKYPVGLCVGSGDEIGWTTVTITPDMVGNRIAVFTSVERKAYGDCMKPLQIKWFNDVKEAGGIAEVYQERKDGTIERMSET